MDTQSSARLHVLTLADIIAFEHIPLAQRALPQSTYTMLCQAAAIAPGRTALHYFADANEYDKGIHLSYAQLMARIHQTANLLSDLGIGPHDVISLLLPNTPQAQYMLWGGEACGIVNPVNFFLEPSQVVSILRAAGTKVLAALGPTPGFAIWEKVQFIREQVPSIEKVIQVGGEPGSDSRVINFEQAIESYPFERLSSGRSIASDETAAFFHTGGTTGSPKLARHTHGNEVYTAWALGVTTDITAQDVRVNGLPLFHVHGAIANSLAPFSRGASVVLPTPAGYRNPEVIRHFWHMIEHYQVNAFSSVPTMLTSLLQVPIADADISSLSFVGSGTAPLSGQTHSAFEQHVGVRIIEGWGLTEATSVSTANPKYGERRIGSIGLRLPYQQIKIVYLDTDGNYLRDCLAGEVGTVVVKGPNVFPGYLDETQNANLWLQDGWLNTGDLGWQDGDGYIWLTGRAKDLIIRGGNNIDPRIIEEALSKHPAVELVAAVGKPDAYAGELPIAYVTLKQDAETSSEALLVYAREMIPERAALPKDIYILEQMPLTPIGKVFKPELRKDAMKRMLTEALSLLSDRAQVAISVADQSQSGTVATITLAGVPMEKQEMLRQRISDTLEAFTFKYRLEFLERGEPQADQAL